MAMRRLTPLRRRARPTPSRARSKLTDSAQIPGKRIRCRTTRSRTTAPSASLTSPVSIRDHHVRPASLQLVPPRASSRSVAAPDRSVAVGSDHPETAEEYGITDGDWCEVYNMFGRGPSRRRSPVMKPGGHPELRPWLVVLPEQDGEELHPVRRVEVQTSTAWCRTPPQRWQVEVFLENPLGRE